MVTGFTSFQIEDTRLHLKRLTLLGYYNGKGLETTCIESSEGDGYGKSILLRGHRATSDAVPVGLRRGGRGL